MCIWATLLGAAAVVAFVGLAVGVWAYERRATGDTDLGGPGRGGA